MWKDGDMITKNLGAVSIVGFPAKFFLLLVPAVSLSLSLSKNKRKKLLTFAFVRSKQQTKSTKRERDSR